jgi:hypothetical protein
MTRSEIEIQVTQEDIDKADVKHSSRCVVATAIHRSVPGAQRVSVDVQTIRFTVAGERFVYLTPYGVTGYIVAFDAGEEIHPFRFRLRSDQEMKVRTTKRTEAGREIGAARSREREAKVKATKMQERLQGIDDPTLPPPSVAEVRALKAQTKLAQEKAKTAEDERKAVMAAFEGERQTEPQDPAKPKAPAQVFKRYERAYGMRQLRINGGRKSGVGDE